MASAAPAFPEVKSPPQRFPAGPIPVRLRADLLETASDSGGLILKDPLRQQFFQLNAEEAFLWRELQHSVGWDDLQLRFADHFAGSVTPAELQGFISQLVDQGLAIPVMPGSGVSRWLGQQAHARAARWNWLLNPLAVRFRGIDPDRWLNRIAPWFRGVFDFRMQLAWLLLVLSALGVIFVEADSITWELPRLSSWFTWHSAIGLAVTLAVAKILHEWGHAIACKHFGGECHEMGVMLLVGTPCLYCDVSDAWRIRERTSRMAITAAGIWVDMGLAALAIWGAVLSQPGWFHSACWNLALVCGAGSLLFNANPLMRYDGYFLLSDLCGVPNLAEESRSALRNQLAHWLFGIPAENGSRAKPAWLASYALLASLYRWSVLVAIFWFFDRGLEPLGLRFLAAGGFLILLAGALQNEFQSLQRWFQLHQHSMSFVRSAIVAGCLGLFLAMLLFWPLPGRVVVPVYCEPDQASRVFAHVGGRVVESVAEGAFVSAGDVLVRLENLPLARELDVLRSRVAGMKLAVENLELRRVREPELAGRIPTLQHALADWSARLQQREQLAERLTVRAPVAGKVYFLPAVNLSLSRNSSDLLPRTRGSVLENKNRGCAVLAGTELCLIAPNDRWTAIGLVPQSEIRRVRAGQVTRLWLNGSNNSILSATVLEVAQLDQPAISAGLARSLDLSGRAMDRGTASAGDRLFPVRLAVDSSGPLSLQDCGSACVRVDSESLSSLAVQWLSRTFGLGWSNNPTKG